MAAPQKITTHNLNGSATAFLVIVEWPNNLTADNLMYGKLNSAKTTSAGGINWLTVDAYYLGFGTRKLILIGNGDGNLKDNVVRFFETEADMKAGIHITMYRSVMPAMNLKSP